MRDVAVLIFKSRADQYIVFIDPGKMHEAKGWQRPGFELVDAIVLRAVTPSAIPGSLPLEEPLVA